MKSFFIRPLFRRAVSGDDSHSHVIRSNTIVIAVQSVRSTRVQLYEHDDSCQPVRGSTEAHFEVAPRKNGNALLLCKYIKALSTPRAARKAMSARGEPSGRRLASCSSCPAAGTVALAAKSFCAGRCAGRRAASASGQRRPWTAPSSRACRLLTRDGVQVLQMLLLQKAQSRFSAHGWPRQ